MTTEDITGWKARCSSLGTIVELTSLTDKQLEKVAELTIREAIEGKGGLTPNMKNDLEELRRKRDNPKLMEGAETLLKTYYAYKIGLDKGRAYSKEIQKGIIMEDTTIELIDNVIFGYQGLIKHDKKLSNDYIEGSPDVEGDDFILEAKSPWDSKTFYSKIVESVDKDYIWQTKGYCILANKPRGVLAYGLVNTPTYACLLASYEGKQFNTLEYETTYEHIDEEKKVVAYTIPILEADEAKIIQSVKMCRDYLVWYDGLIKQKLGNLNNLNE
jgi:hypothetical protein